jgi:hypothetical protein
VIDNLFRRGFRVFNNLARGLRRVGDQVRGGILLIFGMDV